MHNSANIPKTIELFFNVFQIIKKHLLIGILHVVIYILIKPCVFFSQKKADMLSVVDVVELCETVSETVLKAVNM